MRNKSRMQEKKIKLLKGDGLRVEVDTNDTRLEIVGDGCRLTVGRNSGSITIFGDGCSIRVKINDGDIEYRGDGGRISLGSRSRVKSVSYTGDGGKISVNPRVGEKGKARIIEEEVDERVSVSDSEIELGKARLVEAEENKKNEAKEEIDERRRKIIKKINRSRDGNYTVVTKITTRDIPVIIANDLVKNWFVDPSSVLKSFKFNSTESL